MSYDKLLYEAYGYQLQEAKKLKTIDDLIAATARLHKELKPYFSDDPRTMNDVESLHGALINYKERAVYRHRVTIWANAVGEQVEKFRHRIPEKTRNLLDQIRIALAALPKQRLKK